MKFKFLGESFLLESETAERLYFEYANHCPIIDYHCHLSPIDIAQNRKFGDITEAWLEGDHYKWRAMRANGISEAYITGARSNKEKFGAWAATVPYTMRNPLYHWTHLELQRYFGIDELLDANSAFEIYTESSKQLGTDAYTTRSLLQKMNVEVVCTSDDPTDDLSYHQQIANESFAINVLPTWRPDPLLHVHKVKNYKAYVEKLAVSAYIDINNYDDLLEAIDVRHAAFHGIGCVLADHGLNYFTSSEAGPHTMKSLFDKVMSGRELSKEECDTYQSGLMHELCLMNHKRNWTQQFHVGALRNSNTRKERTLGPNTGFDSIGASQNPRDVANFLDRLDDNNNLASTILYNSNPSDNYMYGAMAGNYQDGTKAGKIQFGAAWWFLDQKEGMEMQINALSNLGLISRFVGMVTDSRSFLSFPRHEYFRRILCNMIGKEIEQGLLPNDIGFIGQMVADICYHNAKNYFGFKAKSMVELT